VLIEEMAIEVVGSRLRISKVEIKNRKGNREKKSNGKLCNNVETSSQIVN